MKILFCTNTFQQTQNGPSRFANYLLEINQRFKDVEIRILTEDVDVKSLSTYQGKVIPLNLQLTSLHRFWGFIYRMFPYHRACREIYSYYPYDVVVFNNAITGIQSAVKLRAPVLGMINDYTSLATGWREFDGSWQWFRRFLFRLCERWACAVEQGVIVNSEYLLGRVSEAYGISPSKLRLLYKGVDISRNAIDPPFRPPGTVRVLFVKSDFLLGGLYDVMEALNGCPEFDFELNVAGPSLRYRDVILSRPLRSHVRIRFIGPLPSEEVYRLMASCDLFIVPSHREALGVANIEALFYKLPVITSRVGGITEVMNNGENGWLVEPGKPAELADTIKYVLDNPAEVIRKQQNGYEFVRRHFSHEATLEKFVHILRDFV